MFAKTRICETELEKLVRIQLLFEGSPEAVKVPSKTRRPCDSVVYVGVYGPATSPPAKFENVAKFVVGDAKSARFASCV
jgi:hypothetical protein